MMGKSKSEKISYKDVSEKVRGGLGLTRQELEIRHGQYFEGMNSWCFMNPGDLQNVVMNVEQRLESGWLEKWKSGDDSVWVGVLAETGDFEHVRWPARMEKFGVSPIDVVKAIVPVVAERAMNQSGLHKEKNERGSEVELVVGEMVENSGNVVVNNSEEFGHAIDVDVSGLGGFETEELKLRDGEAIVQFNGRVVEQVRVQDRSTCILAVMQMLLSHSGYIRGDAHVSLIEAKGKMIEIADRIGALVDNVGGTLYLPDVEYSVRPVLQQTMDSLKTDGVSENDRDLGEVSVNSLFLFEGDADRDVFELLMMGGGEEREMPANALAIMADKWQSRENVIFGYTHVANIGEYNTNGHQRIINGVSMIEGQYYFHIIDPLTKMSNNGWVRGIDLVKHLTGPIFWAESKKTAGKPFDIKKDNVLGQEDTVGYKEIRW
jgi:hypothetical protein